MERSRRTGTKRSARQSTLEALRAARAGPSGTRSSQWDVKDEADIYEQVTEAEYADIVRKRRQGEDFVVDDDGLGYFDDGEEHLGEDAAEGLEEEPKAARGAVHAHSRDAVRKARKLKEAREKAGAAGGGAPEEPVEGAGSMFQYLGAPGQGPKKAPTKTAAKALDAFDSLIDGLGSGPAATPVFAKKALDLGAGLGGYAPASRQRAHPTALDRAQLAAPGLRSPPAPRSLDLGTSNPPWAGGVDLGDDMGMGFASRAPAPQAADDGDGPDFAPPPAHDAPLPKKQSRFSKSRTKAAEATGAAVAAMEIETPAPVDAPAAPAEPARMDYGEEEDESAPVADQNYGTGTVVTGSADDDKWLRATEDGTASWFYWLDCVEQAGTIYLLGKVRLEGPEDAYASACCVVRGVERSFFVLPRVDPATGERRKMQDVWAEARAELVGTASCVPKSEPFKCKGVKRGYCFGDDDVPRAADTEYLKIKYAAKFRPPPVSLCKRGGRHIEKILGAGATPLELFLVKRNMMGPCWLEIKKVAAHAPKVSWCAVEMAVSDPKCITVARACPHAPPPLVCTTLALKTVVNPKTHQHEIVACAALTHRGVALDGATPDGGRGEDRRLFAAAPADVSHKAGSRRWTCVAARPLGAEAAAAQDVPLSPKLPRELHQELKDPRQGFLGDKGTVTVAPNERALVSVLLARLQQDDPDVLVGHNILGFELDVLLARALKLGVGNAWSKLGRLRRNKPPRSWKASSGRDTFHASTTAGRLICDTYLSAREHVRGATTYALAALAQTQLGVAGRRSLEPREVALLLGSTAPNVCGLLRHAAEDCRLVERLALRLQVLPLSKQLTAISGNLLARTLKGHRAERIEYLLLHEFHRGKYIAPEKQRYDDDDDDNQKPGAKSKKRDRHAGRAKAAYQGGLVLEPKKGFYDSHVLLLDFASLYPSIIQEYDLCFTTVDWAKYALAKEEGPAQKRRAVEDGSEEENDDVAEAAEELPPLPARADGSGAAGVLPRVLKALIDRRREVKQLLKREKDPKRLETYNIRQMALKLTANSMYGCLGFSHSRFFAKPLAALVTSLGRDTLQATADVAEKELGLEVIYGDTDSIMINTRTDDLALVKELGAKVKKAVNKRYRLLELELDGIFKTMLLLKKKKYAALVVDEDPRSGAVTTHKETKGLDLVRRDWCPLSKQCGQRVLDHLLSGESSDEVVKKVHAVLEDVCQRARAGAVPVADFVVTRGLNKPVEKYPDSKSQPHLRVAKMMLEEGRAVNVGDHIPYVVCVGPEKSVSDRTYHPDSVSADTTVPPPPPPPGSKEAEAPAVVTPGGGARARVDVEWYLAVQILPPVARLCEPVAGMSRASIADKLGLDARKFAQHVARSQSALDEANANMRSFTPMSLMSDEERFGECQPVALACGACSALRTLPLLPRPEEGVDVAPRDDALKCTACGARFLGHGSAAACFSRLSVALKTATRASLKTYYEGWMLCDDAACGARTRQLAGAGPRCLTNGCRGRMVAEASEKAIYTQLCYYHALFDPARLACAPRSEEAEVLKFLQIQVQGDIDLSAYNFVRPSIFNVFEKYY